MGSELVGNYLLAAMLGGWEIGLIIAIVLILFGARKLPNLGRGVRSGIWEFRKAFAEIGEELKPDPKESGMVYEALTHDNRTAEFVYPHHSNLREWLRTMILVLAQGFGVGRIPIGPGTWGSLLGIFWTVILCLPNNLWIYLMGMIAGIAGAVWLCGEAEKILRQKDPPSVVVDEIVALPVCFLPVVVKHWFQQGTLPGPGDFFGHAIWPVTIVVFVLFRIFDIVKPWPVKQSQRLPGGWGVVIDDSLAAVYVIAALSAAIGIGWLR